MTRLSGELCYPLTSNQYLKKGYFPHFFFILLVSLYRPIENINALQYYLPNSDGANWIILFFEYLTVTTYSIIQLAGSIMGSIFPKASGVSRVKFYEYSFFMDRLINSIQLYE